MSTGHIIRTLRRRRRLSQQELASAVGVSAAFLSQIETGKRLGTFETIARIADALRVTVDDLRPQASQDGAA